MFSRGNVTEKKRFGMSLVQSGENILDMYAGIGYYTLPALIHGKARHVTACEWNEHALFALRRNLMANGIPEGAVTVLEGDCRVSLKRLLDREGTSSNNSECNEVKQCYQFDRISLGLLPSSEGGWAIAVSCLHKTTGGWLHVHGNVATAERDNWAHWLCDTLAQYTLPNGHDGWIAVCTHVEKVKSFAPKVDHVVADVFVGPPTSSKLQGSWSEKTTGVFDSVGRFMPTSSVNISTPSCALNEDGILNQSWMRKKM
jgi:tRNA G37 N-methylase Trm5